jgi:hypothetical protein
MYFNTILRRQYCWKFFFLNNTIAIQYNTNTLQYISTRCNGAILFSLTLIIATTTTTTTRVLEVETKKCLVWCAFKSVKQVVECVLEGIIYN